MKADSGSDSFTTITMRNGRTGPGALNCYCSGPAADLSVANEAMVLASVGTQGRHAVAHFRSKSIAAADAITLGFDFVLTALTTNGFILWQRRAGPAPELRDHLRSDLLDGTGCPTGVRPGGSLAGAWFNHAPA